MSRTLTAASLALLLVAAGRAGAQDVLAVAKDHYKVLVDNARIRVVENTLAPGEKDPMHTHPAGCVWTGSFSPGRSVFSTTRTWSLSTSTR